jgi:hypothetical protein
MNQEKQIPGRSVLSAARPKISGNRSQPGPAQRGNGQQPRAIDAGGRAPIAPPAFRIQAAPKALQAKMHNGSSAMQSRSIGCSSSGVVQANVVGGNHALQARLNLWNTRLTRGASLTVGQAGNTNSAQASGTANGSRAIQRKTGPGVEAFRVPLRQKSGGLPLPAEVRAKMETAFGADFSEVRVHIGQEASSLGAIAYTWGTNIHFAPGQYNPHSLQGQKLLGHELWHVVQQRSGRVSNPFGGGVAVVQDHALEAEADRMGIKAALTQIPRKRTE